MKKFIPFFIVYLLLYINCFSQTCWIWQNPYPQSNTLMQVRFINQNTGYACGYNGIVTKTTNGGNNWTVFNTGFNYGNAFGGRFACPDANNIWVVGYGRILHSSNGGNNWISTTTAGDNRDVFFVNSNTGWILNVSSGYIQRTTNGGTSWVYKGSAGVSRFVFVNENLGFGFTPTSGYIAKTTNGGDSWTSQLAPSSDNMFSLSFPSANTGYISAEGGKIFKTTNSGTNWFILNHGVDHQYLDCYFINDNTGWVSDCTNLLIYKTTNGGLNWCDSSTSQTFRDIYSLYFTDASTGIGVGSGGKIIKSTDSGKNWSYISSGNYYNFESVYFIDNNTGWVSGGISSLPASGKIYRTTNSGNNWIDQTPVNLPYSPTIYFFNSQTGFIGSQFGRILKTTNGGINWTTFISADTTNFFNQIFFINQNTGWIIANKYTGQYSAPIFKTTNAGNNWFELPNPATDYGYSIYFVNDQTGWASGWGFIMKTTNGGSNWFLQLSGLTVRLNSVMFINTMMGWVAGESGTFKITTNGGNNWIDFYTFSGELNHIKMLDENTGWMIANGNYVLRTTNAWNSWTNIFVNGGCLGYSFLNSNTGWVVGSGGMIVKTTSGGVIPTFSISGNVKYNDNNQTVTSGIVKALKLDKNTGNLIVIDSAQIQSNGDYVMNNITQDSLDIGVYPSSTPPVDYVTTYYPSTIYWQNATTLYPTGNLTNINVGVFRMNSTTANNSVSGRITQHQMINFNYIKDANIYAKNGNSFVGYAISDVNGRYHIFSLPAGNLKIIVDRLGYRSDSTFVTTTPTSIIDSVNFSLYQIYVNIKKINENIPDSYKLYQNYPNPFNPVTIIKYQIPKDSFIKLKIYDILGREISTLVSDKQTGGSYLVTFDASNLSSGIYFYSLITDDFKAAKKLLLIK